MCEAMAGALAHKSRLMQKQVGCCKSKEMKMETVMLPKGTVVKLNGFSCLCSVSLCLSASVITPRGARIRVSVELDRARA
jgi:hypothetical protein